MKKINLLFLLAITIGFSQHVVAQQTQEAVKPAPMIIEVESPYSYQETLSRFNENVKKFGWKVPKKYDWVKMLKNKGEIGGPMVMYELCKPNHAFALLQNDAYKHLSVMMPCATSFYQKRNGKTYVAYLNVEMIATMYGGEIAEIATKAGSDRNQVLSFLRD